MPESNRKQTMLPVGSTLIHNPIGTACGFHLLIGKARCYFASGRAIRFKRMIDDQILPDLGAHFAAGTAEVRRYFTFGVSESSLSDQLDTQAWPEHIDLGYRSSMPIIELKLISQQAEQTDFATAEAQLFAVITPFLVARDELDLPGVSQKTGGTVATGLWSGSAGLVLHSLAPAIPQLTGHLGCLPGSAESLLAYINKNQN